MHQGERGEGGDRGLGLDIRDRKGRGELRGRRWFFLEAGSELARPPMKRRAFSRGTHGCMQVGEWSAGMGPDGQIKINKSDGSMGPVETFCP